MASTLTTFTGLLKERYADDAGHRVEELTYPDNVALAMLEKRGDTGMVGADLKVPLITALPQGVSAAFATAQTNAATTGGVVRTNSWTIVAGDYYGVVHIGDKVLESSKTNKGAFLEDKIVEIDGLYEQAGEDLSIYLWGNGGQSLGQIAQLPDSTNLILTNDIDGQNFEIGATVVASSNDGTDTSSGVIRTGSSIVTGINRATGTVTINATSDITSLAVGDYLFRQGDFFGSTGTRVLTGIQAYITATDSPGTLNGISNTTRATDPQRFAGCRVQDGYINGKLIEERIRILIAQMTGRFKAKAPTSFFLNPEDFETLVTSLTSRGIRPLQDNTTKFGFNKVDIVTAAGTLPIYADRHCPLGTGFALRMEDWWVSSLGELLHPQNGDGMDILRRQSATDYEFRLVSYPLLACRAPKNSGRVRLYNP